MEYELIGRTIVIADSIDKQIVEHAIQKYALFSMILLNDTRRYISVAVRSDRRGC